MEAELEEDEEGRAILEAARGRVAEFIEGKIKEDEDRREEIGRAEFVARLATTQAEARRPDKHMSRGLAAVRLVNASRPLPQMVTVGKSSSPTGLPVLLKLVTTMFSLQAM